MYITKYQWKEDKSKFQFKINIIKYLQEYSDHGSLELRFWSDILTYKRILGVSAEKPELDWIYIPAE
ncbi:hypothetical protein Avbf_04474 [Armadillidium vulgare]|nr:hypothetical protein Avbf_04474 [Armadillidium vulgare]